MSRRRRCLFRCAKLTALNSILPKALDEEVARAHLAGLGVHLTVMTDAQAEYLSLPKVRNRTVLAVAEHFTDIEFLSALAFPQNGPYSEPLSMSERSCVSADLCSLRARPLPLLSVSRSLRPP